MRAGDGEPQETIPFLIRTAEPGQAVGRGAATRKSDKNRMRCRTRQSWPNPHAQRPGRPQFIDLINIGFYLRQSNVRFILSKKKWKANKGYLKFYSILQTIKLECQVIFLISKHFLLIR